MLKHKIIHILNNNGAYSSEETQTNYSTDGDKFQNYYKDVSLFMKKRDMIY